MTQEDYQMTIPLNNDALTAFRLSMNEQGNVLLTHMMSVWNIIDHEGRQHHAEDLPENMTRVRDLVEIDVPQEPLRLTFDEILTETFRLSGSHRAPDESGWHKLSNIGRVAKRLGVDRAIREAGLGKSFTQAIRNHPGLETLDRDDVKVRVRNPDEEVQLVRMEVICLGDKTPRANFSRKSEFASFTEAYKSIFRIEQTFVSTGTKITLENKVRKEELTYSAEHKGWLHADGSRMKRRDPNETPEHKYRFGELVDLEIGYLTERKNGDFQAVIAVPIYSNGDNDAFLNIIHRETFPSKEEGLNYLHGFKDLERIFETEQKAGVAPIWRWLSELPDN
jgi:hypothetical protein